MYRAPFGYCAIYEINNMRMAKIYLPRNVWIFYHLPVIKIIRALFHGFPVDFYLILIRLSNGCQQRG